VDSLYRIIKSIKQSFFRLISVFGKKKAIEDVVKHQNELDRKLVYSLSRARIPNLKQLKYIKKYLSTKELWWMRGSFVMLILSIAFLVFRFYSTHLQIVPMRGGVYTEGLIGNITNVNPLYASISDVDSDITNLIFSAIFKRNKDGKLENDLIENYEISSDGKEYIFTLKENIRWHDGAEFKVEDVLFTFNAIKDSKFKSPLRQSFVGVNIESINERQFKFILTDPYAAFLDLLTFGILPAEKWSLINPETALTSQLNKKPIGSGPYKFDQLAKTEASGIIKEYKLVVNDDYYGKKPLVDLQFKTFLTIDEALAALNSGLIDGIAYLPQERKQEVIAAKAYNFFDLYMPQLTLIFLNAKKNSILADKAVRQALAHAIDKNKIINDDLFGGAFVVDGPVLPNSFAFKPDIKKYDYNQEQAGKMLESVDWKIAQVTSDDVAKAQEVIENTNSTEEEKKQAEKIVAVGAGSWRKKNNDYLKINLTTIQKDEYLRVVEAIGRSWEKAGVKTEINIVPPSLMQSDIIRGRNFDALFYGQIFGADPDPYAFWHSTQIEEGGYNIANFNNKEVDTLLEEARVISKTEDRQEKYKKFQDIIAEEVPAIFMYSPIYTYLQTKKIKDFNIKEILVPADRFNNISEWYLETGKKLVW